MCGRFTLTSKDLGVVIDDFGAHYERQLVADFRPRYNIAPTQVVPIVRVEAGVPWLRLGRWGFGGASAGGGKAGASSSLTINARSESAARRPLFARAFAERRCVIPADGFFEWRGDAKARQPIWFRPAAGGIVYLAGLFDEGPETPFVVLTTQPAPEVAEVHDRMPVLLDRDRAKAWLARPDRALLEPPPPGWLKKTEVSTRVNDARNDDEACIAGATGQLRLI